ncbi:MAG TPA: CPBP family intramembrane metalloprotease [Clostridiales bacterium]|nr:CPBP family intramembrane metalloprotease [Clostridiales bacterium]
MKKVRGFFAILWPAVVAVMVPVYIGVASVFVLFQSIFGAYMLVTPPGERTFIGMMDLLGYAGETLLVYTLELTDVYTALMPISWILIFFFWYREMLRKEKIYQGGDNTGSQELKIKLFTPGNLFFLALIALGCQIVIGGGMELIQPYFERIMEEYNELIQQFMNGNAVVVFVTTVILAPFSEELLFRGVIMKKAQKIAPAFVAILIQAILFALFHMNIVQSLYTLPAGLILGYVAYKFKSIKASIVLHMMFNALSYVMIMPESTVAFIGYMVFGVIVLVLGLRWVARIGATGYGRHNTVKEA